MFINKNSIVINGVNVGEFLVEAKYSYNKLWASDTGRNLAGVNSGTLIGIFPKIVLTFRHLSKQELEIIVPILDSSSQLITYYDPFKKQMTTIDTYTGDYEIINKNSIENGGKNEGFSCSFISIRKRS